MVEPFRRLLYGISKELSNQDLEDLLFICKVPASAKEDMKDGKSLFKYLEERGVVNEQRIDSLREILKHLHPKRRDLFRLISEYQMTTTDDVRSNRTDDTSSFSMVSIDDRSISAKTIQDNKHKTYCSVDCVCIRCHGCSITKPFCCCYGTAVLLLFILLTVLVFWFAGKPRTVYEYLNAKEYRKDVGIIVVGVLSFLLVAVILPYLLVKRWSRMSAWCRKKRTQRLEHTHRSRSLSLTANVNRTVNGDI